MNKKISLGAAIMFIIIVAAATFSITRAYAMIDFNDKINNLKERESRYSKLAEIDNYVRQNYIGAILESDLTDDTADGFIKGIGDPNAKYYNANEYQLMMDDYSGDMVQIGIETQMDESGYIQVSEVYPESPAQAAGIEKGDLIVRVDETDVTKETYSEAVSMLKGKPGTKMNIVLRKGLDDTNLPMTRRFVEIPSVSSEMIDDQIGLIKFSRFNDNTPNQFSKQVDHLIGQGAQSLIFDVRGVKEGSLRSVSQVLDALLPAGDIILSTDKDGRETVLATSDAGQIQLGMAVVVNDQTSGEAELFAQALKDFGKAKIIGTQTAGKGTMQRIYPLTDGSAIEFTVARYRTPYGPSYDREGVKPDYEVKASEGTIEDTQLKKAIEVANSGMRTALMIQNRDSAK